MTPEPESGELVVHEDNECSLQIDHGRTETLRLQVVELTGEQPLWAERTTLPDGPTRPPLILIHGFAQNRFSWHTSIRSMTAWLAADGWDVWNLELRGHGRSRRRSGSIATTFADYPDDLGRFARALDAPAFWIGHSLGASVAYMADAEDLAPCLGVVGIGGLYRFGQAGWLMPNLIRITRRIPRAIDIGDVQVHTGLSGRIFARLFPIMDMAAYAAPIAGWWPGSIEPNLAKERMRRGFDYIPVRVWQEMSEWGGADEVPWDTGWRKTNTPCFILLGDRDTMLFPLEGQAAFDRSGAADKTLLVLDDKNGFTHWGHMDIVLGKYAPEHVWSKIRDWMADRV